jgi:hypothetical protein
VLVAITDAGQAMVDGRRAVRSERLGALLAELSPDYRAALAAALPALDALASVPRNDDPARTTRSLIPQAKEADHQ